MQKINVGEKAHHVGDEPLLLAVDPHLFFVKEWLPRLVYTFFEINYSCYLQLFYLLLKGLLAPNQGAAMLKFSVLFQCLFDLRE